MTAPRTSRDIPGPAPERDTQRDLDKAQDAAKTDGENRDRVHGDGSEIDLDGK